MLRFDNPRMEGRRRKGKKYAGFWGGNLTDSYALFRFNSHKKVTINFFNLFAQFFNVTVTIKSVGDVRKCMAQHPLPVIFCNVVFFAEIGKRMAAIMGSVALSDANLF